MSRSDPSGSKIKEASGQLSSPAFLNNLYLLDWKDLVVEPISFRWEASKSESEYADRLSVRCEEICDLRLREKCSEYVGIHRRYAEQWLENWTLFPAFFSSVIIKVNPHEIYRYNRGYDYEVKTFWK